MPSPSGLAALSRHSAPSNQVESPSAAVPRPRFRWGTRVLLPMLILLATAALLAWSARDALWPATAVHVAPVVTKPRQASADGESGSATGASPGATQRDTVLVQAPGWIEPDPFAITITALTDGVVREVLILEGQTVEAGEIVARLIDDDAKLAVQLAEAELAERAADVERAKAQHDAAAARAEEVRDERDRKSALTGDGTVSEAIVARLGLRLRALQADIAAATAAIKATEAGERVQTVVLDQARLALNRTEVRSPAAGVVLTRSVEPGSRIAMAGPGAAASPETPSGGVARLYDPSRLQVRVDVPLADAAKVGVGTAARIISESLPDMTFTGTVTRVVHEADIQRNTVQFKVAIDSPDAALKAEALVRVRLLSGDSSGGAASVAGSSTDYADMALLLPVDALIERNGQTASAWFVSQDSRRGATAVRRTLTLGAEQDDGYIEVLAGASPTDRAIVKPDASLTEGARIRVLGEVAAGQGEQR